MGTELRAGNLHTFIPITGRNGLLSFFIGLKFFRFDKHKNFMKKGILLFVVLVFTLLSCEDFLETKPLGVYSDNIFTSEKGIDALLIGAYAMLDGAGAGGWGGSYAWGASVSNWLWGSVASDDAYMGADRSMGSDWFSICMYSLTPYNSGVSDKWIATYDGVARCNDVLKVLQETKEIDPFRRNPLKAEALFLRAWFHFELKRVFDNIPYITEGVKDPGKVTNMINAWPHIESDLQFAVDYLPDKQVEVGRATRYAAMAVLARVHLFQKEYDAAKKLLDKIINSGNYSLMPNFHDNYRIPTNNNAESIFEIQYSVNDGTPESFNGGYGDAMCFPQGNEKMPTCCGLHQPSQNLVNAFKVDSNGLPLLDTYNNDNLKNDMGITSEETFIPSADPVDPRLDWTVGRRGIPYLDWGIMRGGDWIRTQRDGGPYLYVKNMFYESEMFTLSTTSGWATGVNANNYRAYRYAHILLWRAEVAVEENDLATALMYVNMIRTRARDGSRVMGLCTTYELPEESEPVVDYNQPAANYNVQPYPSFPNQEYARKAVRHEIRLEFAMEGHRFFDLVRWGIAAEKLNAFIARDVEFRNMMNDTFFEKGTDEYRPIPQHAIDEQGSDILIQNNGY